MSVAFGVENVMFKQAYLRKAWDHIPCDDEPCLFNDIRALANDEKRKCVVHGKACDLPEKLDMFCSGFSCASLSPLNVESGSNVSAFQQGKAGWLLLFLN